MRTASVGRSTGLAVSSDSTTSADSTDTLTAFTELFWCIVAPEAGMVQDCTRRVTRSRGNQGNASHGISECTYGGVTAEERRASRRAALIEAALDLFGEDGARAVSKRAVCARARLNDRYFYEHFADSDALLVAIAEDLTAQGLAAVNAATMRVAPDMRAGPGHRRRSA